MSFKLAIVVLVIAAVGQGLAWPRTEVESSQNEGFAGVAISSLLRDSSGLSIVEGMQNCVTTGVKILGLYKEKLVLKLSAFSARLYLISKTAGCFIMKTVSEIHNCGMGAFNEYKSKVEKITKKAVQNDEELSLQLKSFPNCLKEATPPPSTTPPNKS